MNEIVIKDKYISRISDEDYERCLKIKWSLTPNKYAKGLFEGKLILMHHFIFGKPEDGFVVDHINRDKLDNRRENLRFATDSQNSQNVPKREGRTYIGTHYHAKRKHWRVYCKSLYFGCFDNELEAAKQFDKAAYVIFGQHAQTNKLIEFEEVNGLTIEYLYTQPKRKLPKNITMTRGKYNVTIEHEKKMYSKRLLATLEEAEAALADFKKIFQKIKDQKEHDANQLDILRNKDGIAIIICTDKEILVDDKLWHNFNQKFWNITDGGYAAMSLNKTTLRMHHMVIGKPPKNMIVDHINHNRLDNRECNLRFASNGANAHNRTKSKRALSQYFGVYKLNKYWAVRVSYDNKSRYFGSYKTELEAAHVYNIKATELYGEFANLNKNLPPLPENNLENLLAKLKIK
jgi:hypothetical protein